MLLRFKEFHGLHNDLKIELHFLPTKKTASKLSGHHEAPTTQALIARTIKFSFLIFPYLMDYGTDIVSSGTG